MRGADSDSSTAMLMALEEGEQLGESSFEEAASLGSGTSDNTSAEWCDGASDDEAAPLSIPKPTLLCSPASKQKRQEKEMIYAHPLFPLLALLIRKCELAMRDQGCVMGSGVGVDCPEGEDRRLLQLKPADSHLRWSVASFEGDVVEFKKTLQLNRRYYSPNPELDSLLNGNRCGSQKDLNTSSFKMLNTIQVLRYQLLELEKMHELCDSFCDKYSESLKLKMSVAQMTREMGLATSLPSTVIHPQQSGFGTQGLQQCHVQHRAASVWVDDVSLMSPNTDSSDYSSDYSPAQSARNCTLSPTPAAHQARAQDVKAPKAVQHTYSGQILRNMILGLLLIVLLTQGVFILLLYRTQPTLCTTTISPTAAAEQSPHYSSVS